METKIIAVIQIIFGVALLIGCAFLNEYSIETIASFFGKQIDFPFWAAALLTFVPVLGQLCIPVAAITFILTFII